MTKFKKYASCCSKQILAGVISCTVVSALAHANNKPPQLPPLLIKDHGSKFFGGSVVGDPATASLHCDHGYVQWMVPNTSRPKLPILMWHSAASKTWETPTPWGGEAFDNIFMRRGYPVYILDAAPSGRAGQACNAYTYTPSANSDQSSFNSYRLGIWIPPAPPMPFPNTQAPVNDPKAMDQIRRANYVEDQSAENEQITTDSAAALLKDIGPTVLFTHSGSGVRGWWTRVKSNNVKAIVAFEPGSFLFPQGEVPPDILRADGQKLTALGNGSPGAAIPLSDFKKLTQIPILIIVGDNIPKKLDPINTGPRLGLDNNRLRVIRINLFADAINRHRGDASVYVLPDHGIHGNTHFSMWDRNNAQVAAVVAKFLKSKGFEGYPYPSH